MTAITRKRLVAAGMVALFVVVFAAIGAVSRPSPTAAQPAVAVAADAQPTVPFTPWYWTMAVSPKDPNVLVLATSSGLYRSGDGGKTWKPTGPRHVNATSLVGVGNALFMGGVSRPPGSNPSPIVWKGAGRVAPDGAAVLARSTDDGKTWRTLHPRGLPSVSVQALAADPADDAALYALLNTGKLYRSTDGAGSFRLVTSKLGISPWAIAITEGNGFVSGDMDSGSHLSSNAKKWQQTPFTDSAGGRMVMEYAVQPDDSANVLMSSVGIVRSTDGGKTWKIVLKSSVMFGPIAWAPSTSGVAYAIGFDRSLWRSDDGGDHWTRVS